MTENKFRRLRPITTVQQILAGAGGFLPTPPLGKLHFPPPIRKTGLGCTVCEPTPVLAPPLGKRHFPPPIRKTGLGSTLCEPTPVLAPPLGKRHFPPPIRKTGLGSRLCEPTPVLAPPLGKRHFPPPVRKTGLGSTLCEPTPVLAPPLGKRHFPPPVRKTGLGSTQCEPTSVLAPPLGKRHFPPPIRKTGLGSTLCEPTSVLGAGGLLPAPPLGKRPVPPPILKRALGPTLCEPTPVLGAPPPKRNIIRTSKVEILPPLQRPPRVGVPQQEERSSKQSKREYDNRSFLQKAEAEVQCLKIAIHDDDNALSPINERFLELENEIKNLQKYSRILEGYQSSIPNEISRAIKDESDKTAERLKQTSRDITRNIEKLERVKVKRNLLLDQREKHKKSLKKINDSIRPAQEARNAVLIRIIDSVN